MTKVQEHMSKLGFTCKDRVTGFSGVITGVCFDLYGCIQAIVNPGLDKDGKQKDSAYFDIMRLDLTSKKPVMDVPNFVTGVQADGKQGAAEKPAARH